MIRLNIKPMTRRQRLENKQAEKYCLCLRPFPRTGWNKQTYCLTCNKPIK